MASVSNVSGPDTPLEPDHSVTAQTTETPPILTPESVHSSVDSNTIERADESRLSTLGKGLKTALRFGLNLIKNFAKYVIGYPLMGLGIAALFIVASPFILAAICLFAATVIIGAIFALIGKIVNIAIALPIGIVGGLILSPKIIFDMFFTKEGFNPASLEDYKIFKFSSYISSAAAYPFSILGQCFMTLGAKLDYKTGGSKTLAEWWQEFNIPPTDEPTAIGSLFIGGSISVFSLTLALSPLIGIGKLIQISAQE